MTAEATTNLSGNTYYITSQAKRCIDPASIWHVKDGVTTLAYTAVSVNFLFGEVTLGSAPGGAVTITGNYLPLTTASEFLVNAKGFKVNRSTDMLDVTTFASTLGLRLRDPGLMDATVSVDMLLSETELNALRTYSDAGTAVVIEIYWGTDPRLRMYSLIDSIEVSGSVDGLIEASVGFKMATYKSSEGAFFTGYSEKTLL